MLLDEYRRSLKMPEAEEILDLLFYRPAAFLVVKSIYRLPITPNQLTAGALIAGLAAAYYFAAGTEPALPVAALWYTAANILDCSDGQLARLQDSGTLLGRVVDGMVDYVSGIAVFLGIGVGLSYSHPELWWLVVTAGVSSAVHAIFFDRFQGEFISTVRGEKNFLDAEMERFTLEIQNMETGNRQGVKKVFLRLYLRYLKLQKTSATKHGSILPAADHYRAKNSVVIRLWSLLGPTTNRSLLIVSALVGRVDLFLWSVTILGNGWLMICFVLQRRMERSMNDSRNGRPALEQQEQ